ncbi:Solute carrier organic anion transporter family member 3A1 [Takifugu flavidus]|uniref:Solute carrier organic anion transporter family member 3A1 n=1 Tax=Takifugu flavidus TaxID=433684 RepID=A0A5C6NKC7_9TELE|nr:Solute carrier organic anion transporter family member 3A1 [Takifugu flavidus]
MQVKNQICTERSSTDDPEQDENQKKTSCFSNIKIFLVSECALMLAQGTVGAYLCDHILQLPRGALRLMTGCVFSTRPMRILRQRVTASAAQPARCCRRV